MLKSRFHAKGNGITQGTSPDVTNLNEVKIRVHGASVKQSRNEYITR